MDLSDAEDGSIRHFFVVPRDGEPYALPETGDVWIVRVKGHEPGRYDSDRFARDVVAEFEAEEEEDLAMYVQAIDPAFGREGTTWVEGFAKLPHTVKVVAQIRMGQLGLPGGIAMVLVQNEVRPEDVKRLAASACAPVGRVTLTTHGSR